MLFVTGTPFEEITISDIYQLVESRVQEDISIEFKLQLPVPNENSEKEFLYDVVSFANSAGGFLVYGIQEKAGTAIEAHGITDSDKDKQKQRLHNLLSSRISPRIPGIQIKPVEENPEKYFLIIAIPKSYFAPHMLKGVKAQFTARNSAGKYHMEIEEIRQAFTLQVSFKESVNLFRSERINKIMEGDDLDICPGPKIILHIIPMSAFVNRYALNMAQIKAPLPGIGTLESEEDLGHRRFNLDGLFLYDKVHNEPPKIHRCCQVFRSGILETVDNAYCEYDESINLDFFENQILKFTERAQTFLSNTGIYAPLAICLSLIGVKGLSADTAIRYSSYGNPRRFDRAQIILPEIVLEENYSGPELEKQLRQIFDMLWGAAGFPGSLHYDEHGNRKSVK